MLLQFLYQKGLMYRLVAMGQAHPMEVTGEGVRGRTYRGLFFLIPFLVVVYVSYQSTGKKELGGIVRTNAGSLVSFREVSDMTVFLILLTPPLPPPSPPPPPPHPLPTLLSTISGLFLQLFQVANSGRLFYLYFFSSDGLCLNWQVCVSACVCQCRCVSVHVCVSVCTS